MAGKNYRAICFDLDGTLLPMELNEFMKAYFQLLGAYAARLGVAPETFSAGMKTGIRAMASHNDDRPNSEAFWEGFFTQVKQENIDWKTQLTRFYEYDFLTIGKTVKPNPAAARAVNILAAKKYPLVLATMPMFPLSAVKHRLEWAGVNPNYFARITSYENSTSTKPKPTYYAENLAALGAAGSDVLMVGNNTQEDLAFMDLGADAFLVTDYLLNPLDFQIERVPNGSLEAFADWAETLPVCDNPATDIKTGLISADMCESVLSACGMLGV